MSELLLLLTLRRRRRSSASSPAFLGCLQQSASLEGGPFLCAARNGGTFPSGGVSGVRDRIDAASASGPPKSADASPALCARESARRSLPFKGLSPPSEGSAGNRTPLMTAVFSCDEQTSASRGVGERRFTRGGVSWRAEATEAARSNVLFESGLVLFSAGRDCLVKMWDVWGAKCLATFVSPSESRVFPRTRRGRVGRRGASPGVRTGRTRQLDPPTGRTPWRSVFVFCGRRQVHSDLGRVDG